MTDIPTPDEIAEVLCRERCAQMGDGPCSQFDDAPHCDECTGMAMAVILHLKEQHHAD
jgi:hypothetical protein